MAPFACVADLIKRRNAAAHIAARALQPGRSTSATLSPDSELKPRELLLLRDSELTFGRVFERADLQNDGASSASEDAASADSENGGGASVHDVQSNKAAASEGASTAVRRGRPNRQKRRAMKARAKAGRGSSSSAAGAAAAGYASEASSPADAVADAYYDAPASSDSEDAAGEGASAAVQRGRPQQKLIARKARPKAGRSSSSSAAGAAGAGYASDASSPADAVADAYYDAPASSDSEDAAGADSECEDRPSVRRVRSKQQRPRKVRLAELVDEDALKATWADLMESANCAGVKVYGEDHGHCHTTILRNCAENPAVLRRCCAEDRRRLHCSVTAQRELVADDMLRSAVLGVRPLTRKERINLGHQKGILPAMRKWGAMLTSSLGGQAADQMDAEVKDAELHQDKQVYRFQHFHIRDANVCESCYKRWYGFNKRGTWLATVWSRACKRVKELLAGGNGRSTFRKQDEAQAQDEEGADAAWDDTLRGSMAVAWLKLLVRLEGWRDDAHGDPQLDTVDWKCGVAPASWYKGRRPQRVLPRHGTRRRRPGFKLHTVPEALEDAQHAAEHRHLSY